MQMILICLVIPGNKIDDGTITNTNFSPKNASGAAFRSLPPSGVATRYMPKLSSVLAGNLTLEDPDVSSSWETLSSVPRDLNFGFTVRDNALGGGGVTLKKMKVSVVDSDGALQCSLSLLMDSCISQILHILLHGTWRERILIQCWLTKSLLRCQWMADLPSHTH